MFKAQEVIFLEETRRLLVNLDDLYRELLPNCSVNLMKLELLSGDWGMMRRVSKIHIKTWTLTLQKNKIEMIEFIEK